MEERGPMIEETNLSEEEFNLVAHLIPGPEPVLVPIGNATGTTGRSRIIRVCEPQLDGNELRYLTECIQSNWISSAGGFVSKFEKEFARAVGCEFGVACTSGTTALHLALATLGLGPGDEVIVPTFSMIASANAVSYTGATPVLVDAEPETWNMDVRQLESKITEQTRAIMVVHTYGHPVDMDPILDLARRRGLRVLEDAAEAHGAQYHGTPVGSIGDAAAFSFYGNKIITTGEGGMVTTNDAEFARIARRLRDHAFSEERHFWHNYLGFNYRMTNLQAAVGLAQTERLPELVEARRRNARRYEERLRGIGGLRLRAESSGVRSVFWMYGILVQDAFGCSRDELRRRLAGQGIETRTFFIPIHLQPIYYRRHSAQAYPIAEDLCRQGMYLPSGPGLTDEDLDAIVQAVAQAQRDGG
jgi:perosamine synthetase